MAGLTRQFKPRAMRSVLPAMKVRGMVLYTQNPPHPMPTRVDDIGKRHQNGAAGNALRAGVFGVNDGLVSNAALIYGVAGAAVEPAIIVLTGVAGLLAGAFSMAAGEYVSVFRGSGIEFDEVRPYIPGDEIRTIDWNVTARMGATFVNGLWPFCALLLRWPGPLGYWRNIAFFALPPLRM